MKRNRSGSPSGAICFFALLACSVRVNAGVDTVYHPYVDAYLTEIEYRVVVSKDSDSDPGELQRHKLAVGHGFTDQFSMEFYLIGEKLGGDAMELEAYEIEATWQLTQQGEYWSDWGLLLELEREREDKKWELGIGLLWEKELGGWSAAANLVPVYEFGDDVDNELEWQTAAQFRYRFSRQFEPALEIYWDEDQLSVGPAMMGTVGRGSKAWKWEVGLLAGMDSESPDHSFRALLEYEF